MDNKIANAYSGELCKLYTLEGVQKAKIIGRLNKFATIASLESDISIEVNWPLVERKMQGDKTFYSC